MKRIPELDGVRGLAALSVVFFHAAPLVFYVGWTGVDLFFVLSGFLITRIILAGSGRPGFLREFYLRRARRIWPVYFLTLAAVVVLNAFSRVGYSTAALPWHLVFLQNTPAYWGGAIPEFIDSFHPSWSVAVEEQYYLLWPLVILLGGRRVIPVAAAALLVAATASRFWLTCPDLLLTRGDGLALGCLLAWVLQRPPSAGWDKATRIGLAAAGGVGLAFVAVDVFVFAGQLPTLVGRFQYLGFSLLFVALVGTCVVSSGHRWLAVFRNPLLCWLGTISYALYLFHMPIYHYAPRLLDAVGMHSQAGQMVGEGMLIVVLPALSWYCLEKPILSLGGRAPSSAPLSEPEVGPLLPVMEEVPAS